MIFNMLYSERKFMEVYLLKGRLRGDLITVYRYLHEDHIADTKGLFTLADKVPVAVS